MVRISQMDFDLALAQMMHLCISPEKAFVDAKHRKLTKNHWSRDDPAFVVLLVLYVTTHTPPPSPGEVTIGILPNPH